MHVHEGCRQRLLLEIRNRCGHFPGNNWDLRRIRDAKPEGIQIVLSHERSSPTSFIVGIAIESIVIHGRCGLLLDFLLECIQARLHTFALFALGFERRCCVFLILATVLKASSMFSAFTTLPPPT